MTDPRNPAPEKPGSEQEDSGHTRRDTIKYLIAGSIAASCPVPSFAMPGTTPEVKLGSETERKVIVRGIKPFKITAVKGTDALLSVKDNSNVSKSVHVLTIKVRGQQTGDVNRTVKVLTDLDGEGSIEFSASARITP